MPTYSAQEHAAVVNERNELRDAFLLIWPLANLSRPKTEQEHDILDSLVHLYGRLRDEKNERNA